MSFRRLRDVSVVAAAVVLNPSSYLILISTLFPGRSRFRSGGQVILSQETTGLKNSGLGTGPSNAISVSAIVLHGEELMMQRTQTLHN